MFKHLLLPVDGIAETRRSVRQSIRLARSVGARITALHVSPEYPPVYAAEGMALAELPSVTSYRRNARETAAKYLAPVAKMAGNAGIRCATLCVFDNQPHAAIVRTARQKKCDLIVMRVSSRKPLSRWLFGTETRKVLGRSSVPLLIFR